MKNSTLDYFWVTLDLKTKEGTEGPDPSGYLLVLDARNNGLFSYVSIGYHCYYIHKISLKAEYTEPFVCVSQSC